VFLGSLAHGQREFASVSIPGGPVQNVQRFSSFRFKQCYVQ
jgi:hypothetical protein